MVAACRRRAFTATELVVVLVVIAILLLLLPVWLVDSRDPYRRSACINNMKQLGLGLHNHHDAKRRFPPSCGLGTGGAQDGWSWLTYILPFVEQEVLYDELRIDEQFEPGPSVEPLGPGGVSLAFNIEISAFECPSYSGPRFAYPKSSPPSGALTNYKAIGATHHGSLAQAKGGGGNPPAKYEGEHPDGALCPGIWAKISTLADGTSNTVMACETIEQREAVWCLGSTATLVGLPPSVSYAKTSSAGGYWAPAGYNGEYDRDSGTADVPTYLCWDYDDDGPYLSKQYRAGPSSEHPAVVNHLFADGTVRSISKEIDASLYFFIITRAGGDPGSDFHECDY